MHKVNVREEINKRGHVEHRTTCSCGWTEKSTTKWKAEARGKFHEEFPHREPIVLTKHLIVHKEA